MSIQSLVDFTKWELNQFSSTRKNSEIFIINVYNPDTAVYEPLGDFRDTASLFVRRGEGEKPEQGGF